MKYISKKYKQIVNNIFGYSSFIRGYKGIFYRGFLQFLLINLF